MNYSQGDVVLVPFPFSDNTGTKLRPAMIVSNSKVNASTEIILVQITSTIRNDKFTFSINDRLLTYPITYNCELRCHKLFTAQKKLVVKKISSLKSKNLTAALELIRSFFTQTEFGKIQ